MAELLIEGGKRLSGRIAVGGNKNAALPLLAVPFLTADALLALDAQHETVPVADALAERTSPKTETVAEERPFAGPDPQAIETLQARIDDGLADGRLAGTLDAPSADEVAEHLAHLGD